MKKLLTLLMLLAVINFADAQTPTTEKTSHYKAAEELMSVMNIDKMMDDVTSEMLDMQAKSNPLLASKRPVLEAFFKKYMSWNALKDDFIKIYTSEFTEKELKDIVAFYRTPTGKKLADKTGALTIKGSKLGQQRVQEHMGELQEMLLKEQ